MLSRIFISGFSANDAIANCSVIQRYYITFYTSKNKNDKTCVSLMIPSASPTSSDHYLHATFVLFCGRTYENNDHYRPGLCDGRVDQYQKKSNVSFDQLTSLEFSCLFIHNDKIQSLSLCILDLNFLIFPPNIDPRGRPTVTAGSGHYFRTCCLYVRLSTLRTSVSLFKISQKNKVQARKVIATGGTVGLTEWIIDDTHVLFSHVFPAKIMFCLSSLVTDESHYRTVLKLPSED